MRFFIIIMRGEILADEQVFMHDEVIGNYLLDYGAGRENGDIVGHFYPL